MQQRYHGPSMSAKRFRSVCLGCILVLLVGVFQINLHVLQTPRRDLNAAVRGKPTLPNQFASQMPPSAPKQKKKKQRKELVDYETNVAPKPVSRQDDPNKPYFVLHVGPPKTATSTLQMELTRFRDILKQDDYLFLGTDSFDGSDMLIHTLLDKDCMSAVNHHRTQGRPDEERPLCWQQFLNRLGEFRSMNKNVIISEEWFSVQFATYKGVGRTSIDWIALQEALQDWNVLVVVGYRRLFDILPSAKSQWDRWHSHIKALNYWPPLGRTLEPLFPHVLDDPHLNDGYLPKATHKQGVKQWCYTDYLLEMIEPYFPVKILDIHLGRVRTNFLCEILPNAKIACQSSRATDAQEPESKANVEQSLFYDAMVTKAAEMGMVDTEKHKRHETVVKLVEYYEEHLGRDPKELDQICPPEDQLNYLLERSIAKEKKLMPHKLEADHRQAFEVAKRKKKFCWIDAEKALMRPELRQFFANLDNGGVTYNGQAQQTRRLPGAPYQYQVQPQWW